MEGVRICHRSGTTSISKPIECQYQAAYGVGNAGGVGTMILMGPEQLASRSLSNVSIKQPTVLVHCDAFPRSALRMLAPKLKPVHEHVSEKSGTYSPLVVIYQGGPEK